MAFGTEHAVHGEAYPDQAVTSTASIESEYLAAEQEDTMHADLVNRTLPWEDDEEYGDMIQFDNNLDEWNALRYDANETFNGFLDDNDMGLYRVRWYPIALYPSSFNYLDRLPHELRIQALLEMLRLGPQPIDRTRALQMLGQVVGNGAQLEALATAIQDHLGWLRRARARQADADALKIEDKDQYSSLVE